jgi:hypothetical protein
MTTSKKAGVKPVVKPSSVPMSEAILHKDDSPRSAEECVKILRAMAEREPEKVISRNYFRVNSPIAESVWNAHFGTFHEFKRQAGIVLTRQQHKMEREVAKHASVDHYRKMSIERADYGDKYRKPKDTRFKTAILASDLHDKEIDPFYLRVLIDTVKRVQPDLVSLVGDVFDLAEFGKYPVDPREWDASGRILFTHKQILGPIREAAPDAEFDVIEGNHEARLLRMLADATPALRAVLSDIHGMTVSQLLGLDRFQINYVAKADLAAYTERDLKDELRNNYRVYWNCLLAHHFPDARSMGLPGVNGHHHRHQVWPMFNALNGAYEWHQMGSGHRRDASYCNGEKWHMGFQIAHVDTLTRSTQFDYITIGETFAVVGGKFYTRQASEIVTPKRLAVAAAV